MKKDDSVKVLKNEEKLKNFVLRKIKKKFNANFFSSNFQKSTKFIVYKSV